MRDVSVSVNGTFKAIITCMHHRRYDNDQGDVRSGTHLAS